MRNVINNAFLRIKIQDLLKLTVAGSSKGLSSSVCRRNMLPRDIRQSILSKAGTRSRLITPPTNLQENRVDISGTYYIVQFSLYDCG